MSLPGLVCLGVVCSLGNVRGGVDVSVVCDVALVAHGVTVVACVKFCLADIAFLGSVSRINLKDSPSIGFKHVTCTPVHLTSEPSTEPHSVTNM